MKTIELFKDKNGYIIRKGILRSNCVVDRLTKKDLMTLAQKILKLLDTDEYLRPYPLLGTSKIVVKKGKFKVV